MAPVEVSPITAQRWINNLMEVANEIADHPDRDKN
jgi:hypothetical protein